MIAAARPEGRSPREAARLHDYVAAELRRLGVEVDDDRLALVIGSVLDAGVRPSLRWLEQR